MSSKRFSVPVRVAVVAVATVATAGACGSSKSSSGGDKSDSGGTKSVEAPGAKSAAADVSIVACANDPTVPNFAKATVKVTNHSSKTSTYAITVAVESADGATQVGTGNGFVQNLAPGQTNNADVILTTAIPAGAKCKVAQVDRLAS